MGDRLEKFRKILIANRGEIAVRVIRACRELEISPVVVYSDADAEALHVKLSDEAYNIGPAASTESYLCIEKVIDVAQRSGAEAVHPGYGFLSENQQFAQACQDSGLTFIGPTADSMRVMGDKVASRVAVQAAGVAAVPGTAALESIQDAVRAAGNLGYPVMLKASAGGGGKGLRLVSDEEQLSSVYETTRNEARSSFNEPTVYLEKYLSRPRHLEIQILGDLHGNLIHLGERECSIQRRHQKLLEESPSPMMGESIREQLAEAALTVAKTVDYQNAGTVEFLVDSTSSSQQPKFYFLEMNTRLQVEHPVTEIVTGIDLVQEQILIAAGNKLRYSQPDVRLRGSAIQCRIYAEDPQNQFLPSPGRITTYFEPSGPGIRNDSGVYAQVEVPVEYDPLISKLLAYGEDRGQAIGRMRRALREYKIGGIQTTIPFFEVLLSDPEFLEGSLHTHFLEERELVEKMKVVLQKGDVTPLIAAALYYRLRNHSSKTAGGHPRDSLWKHYGRFPDPFR